jgi:hypothetical protein
LLPVRGEWYFEPDWLKVKSQKVEIEENLWCSSRERGHIDLRK